MLEETASDMFLNWVYRSVEPNSGFRNRDWRWNQRASDGVTRCSDLAAGCPDPTNPGDERWFWVQDKMNDIFDEHGWR